MPHSSILSFNGILLAISLTEVILSMMNGNINYHLEKDKWRKRLYAGNSRICVYIVIYICILIRHPLHTQLWKGETNSPLSIIWFLFSLKDSSILSDKMISWSTAVKERRHHLTSNNEWNHSVDQETFVTFHLWNLWLAYSYSRSLRFIRYSLVSLSIFALFNALEKSHI